MTENLEHKLLTPEVFSALVDLAARLKEATAEETAARIIRTTVEAKIAKLIPGKEEGQRTINLPDKQGIVVKRGLTYKAKVEEIEKLWASGEIRTWEDMGIERTAPPVEVETVRSLDITGYKWYRENLPEIFKKIAEFVEVKPRKTSVTLRPAPKTKK